MELKVGARLKSQVCATTVMVVKAPATGSDLRCGGHPMVGLDSSLTAQPAAAFLEGTQMGKRYVYGEILEVLCTSAGEGSLSVGEEILVVKDAKSLPSSD